MQDTCFKYRLAIDSQLETINSEPHQKQYAWFVLANYVTMHIRTSGTVSFQPLPSVSSVH